MPLHIIDYRNAETFDDVAEFLGLTSLMLRQATAASLDPDSRPVLYIRHKIPKRRGRGQVRTVWDVNSPQIRDAHRSFAWRFEDFARDVVSNFPHPCAYGYVRKRSIKDNAAQHLGANRLLRFDLRDFFSTITQQRLAGRFVQIGLNPEAARVLAHFTTIEGTLALGLNASPMLANLVCSVLDAKLNAIASTNGCRYTRYADDIAISGDQLPASGALVEIVEGEGFRLAKGKMRITKIGQAHFVTGLSVSDSRAPHVPRRFKQRLRQELYYSGRFGIRAHLAKISSDRSYQKGINRIDGSVRFIAAIEPQLGQRMRGHWNASLAAESATVSYSPVHDKAGLNAIFLIDETEFDLNGERFLAVACVTTEQIELVRAHVMTTLRSHLKDPFSPGRKKKLANKGLHFTDAPEQLRSRYILFLRFLPFRAYVAFGRLKSADEYSALYAKLLEVLLVRRFKSYDRGIVKITVEENPQISKAQLTELIASLYRQLEEGNERRPIVLPEVSVPMKHQEPALSLADALLWIFGRTFAARDGAGEVDYLRFESLRDKYRHIVNVDSAETFSRRHPIEMRQRTP
jgi:RNA-directed DNA polymerase